MTRLKAIILIAVVGAACHRLEPALSPGESVFRRRCGNCHDLPHPDDYDAKEWRRIVPEMASYAHLSANERERILEWLTVQGAKRPE